MDLSLTSAMPSVICMISLTPQYSQLVMAVRKAKTETPGSVSKARAKSAMVGTETALQTKMASSDPSYEALTQR